MLCFWRIFIMKKYDHEIIISHSVEEKQGMLDANSVKCSEMTLSTASSKSILYRPSHRHAIVFLKAWSEALLLIEMKHFYLKYRNSEDVMLTVSIGKVLASSRKCGQKSSGSISWSGECRRYIAISSLDECAKQWWRNYEDIIAWFQANASAGEAEVPNKKMSGATKPDISNAVMNGWNTYSESVIADKYRASKEYRSFSTEILRPLIMSPLMWATHALFGMIYLRENLRSWKCSEVLSRNRLRSISHATMAHSWNASEVSLPDNERRKCRIRRGLKTPRPSVILTYGD